MRNFRGTWAWLTQRISAICLLLLIPLKIWTGWASQMPSRFSPRLVAIFVQFHANAVLDIALLFFFLVHAFYGLRVILIDLDVIKEDRWFWRMLLVALGIFGLLVWFVYFHAAPRYE